MKFARLKFLMVVFSLGLPSISLAQPQAAQQTPQLIESLNNYFSSGEYISELEKKTLEAKYYLDDRLKRRGQEKLAIVLNIDETSLSNLESLQRSNYSTNVEAFTANYLYSTLPAIGPTLGLYNYAKRRDVEIFFVSSRPNVPEVINATVSNLKQVGFREWKDLILKPIHDNNLTNAAFKKNARSKIQDMGYTIILNIGDQESDIQGGLAEVSIKYPNPFYLNNARS